MNRPETHPRTATPAPAILVEDLHQRFGDVVALDGLDLRVEPGTVFGLLGPNGTGKTTLVHILSTLQQPTSGAPAAGPRREPHRPAARAPPGRAHDRPGPAHPPGAVEHGGRAAPRRHDGAADHAVPRRGAIFGALVTGIGLTDDLKAGVVDRFRSLPIARSAVLIGRTAADVVMNVLTLIVMVLVGIAVGFRPDQPAYDLALAFVLVLAFSYVFSWISAFVGLSVKDPETAQSAGLLWVLPLTFASSAFVPTSSMPGALRWFADILLLVFVALSVRAFRRA